MTKREHETLQNVVNLELSYRDEADRCFNELMELNGNFGPNKTRWCSAKKNYKELIGTEYESKAESLYERYVEMNAMCRHNSKLMSALSEVNFWK